MRQGRDGLKIIKKALVFKIVWDDTKLQLVKWGLILEDCLPFFHMKMWVELGNTLKHKSITIDEDNKEEHEEDQEEKKCCG